VKRNAEFRVECMKIKIFWDMTLSTGKYFLTFLRNFLPPPSGS
jgi:hypothetical protein